MPCTIVESGDTLDITQDSLPGTIVHAGMWFFVAAAIVALTLLPLGGSGRDPYPWGPSLIAWTLAAAVSVGGVGVLSASSGLTFDRRTYVLVEWRRRFGRRRETRIPLSAFAAVQVATRVYTTRRGSRVRWWDLELKGPATTYRVTSTASLGREDSEEAADRLSAFLRLPRVLLDHSPGEPL